LKKLFKMDIEFKLKFDGRLKPYPTADLFMVRRVWL